MLKRPPEAGHLKAKGKQRTDSTAVLADIRELSQLELVGETVRAALNEGARIDPEWLRAVTTQVWLKLFDQRVEDSRLPTGKEARTERAGLIGEYGFELLEAISGSRPFLSGFPSEQVLQRVWDEQFDSGESGPRPTSRERRGRAHDSLTRTAASSSPVW